MKSKPKIYISFILTVLLFSGCTEEIFEPSNENFQAKSFISNIKSFETNATYKNEIFPVDTLSENKPYVTVQSWVVKGKDILVSITVPNDASELYFGASNSSSEYMGLNFSEEYQTIPSGYYQLDLSTLKAVKAGTVGYNNYQVVLSSVEDIQVDEFDLVLGYKSADGYSNLTSTMLDVKSIAPYQENLKVGFQPLTGYTYSIEITTPSGKTVKYSSNGGSEVFDNPQVPDANLTYDSSLGFNWIDFSNPEFGSYSLTAKIEINISGSSQYIYIYLAVITEGKIEQVNLDADIQQTGQNTALGTVNLGFDYFTEYKNISVNINAFEPSIFEMHNPSIQNVRNEIKRIVPEEDEESPGVGLRICDYCIEDYNILRIRLEALMEGYSEDEISFFIETFNNPKDEVNLYNDSGDRIELFFNDKVQIYLDKNSNQYSKDIFVKGNSSDFSETGIRFYIVDKSNNILSEDIIKIYPVNISKVSLRGIKTNFFGECGHAWITIETNNSKSSYGFWPESGSVFDFIGITEEKGLLLENSGDFDNDYLSYYDFNHEFYIRTDQLLIFYNYTNEIKNNPEILWNLYYNCATFASTGIQLLGVDIPIYNWPNDIANWIIDFENDN